MSDRERPKRLSETRSPQQRLGAPSQPFPLTPRIKGRVTAVCGGDGQHSTHSRTNKHPSPETGHWSEIENPDRRIVAGWAPGSRPAYDKFSARPTYLWGQRRENPPLGAVPQGRRPSAGSSPQAAWLSNATGWEPDVDLYSVPFISVCAAPHQTAAGLSLSSGW